jgi:hypothetical protein
MGSIGTIDSINLDKINSKNEQRLGNYQANNYDFLNDSVGTVVGK